MKVNGRMINIKVFTKNVSKGVHKCVKCVLLALAIGPSAGHPLKYGETQRAGCLKIKKLLYQHMEPNHWNPGEGRWGQKKIQIQKKVLTRGRFHKLFCALRPTFEKLFRGVGRALRLVPNFDRAISMICALRPTFVKQTPGPALNII